MISFIVIGRNEGWKIKKCIQSIIDTVSYHKILDSEIVYVDSNSDDASLKNVSEFNNVKIILLTKDKNAAIARNVGALEVKGDVLIFIDGDMEIIKDQFMEIFENRRKLKYDFISGDFMNYYYLNKDSKVVLERELYHKNTKTTKNFTTGGLFAISKVKWDLIGGMREVFRRSQDMDFGLRLAKKDVFLYRLPIKLAHHHTVNYRSKGRLWRDLKDDTHLYARSLLYRKNLANPYVYKVILNQDYTFIILILSIILCLLFSNLLFLTFYFISVFFRALIRKRIDYIVYFILRDIKVLFGFLFFYPKSKKVSYEIIKN